MPRYDTRAHRSSTVQRAHARGERETERICRPSEEGDHRNKPFDEKVIRKFHRLEDGCGEVAL